MLPFGRINPAVSAIVGVLIVVIVYQQYSVIKLQSEVSRKLRKSVEDTLKISEEKFKVQSSNDYSDGHVDMPSRHKSVKKRLETVTKALPRANKPRKSNKKSKNLQDFNGNWTSSVTDVVDVEKLDFLPNLRSDEEKDFNEKSPRIGLIVYVPYRPDKIYIFQFAAITYSSWKYINSHREIARKTKIPGWKNLDSLVISDMLIWCAKLACPDLPKDCLPHTVPITGYKPVCRWFVQEEHPEAAVHGWINVFLFASHEGFKQVAHLYDYIFRIDTDVVLTPGFLAWYPNGRETAFNYWYYCTDFNMKRLTDIAKNLKLRNQNVHCIGSSLYMTPNVTLKVGPLTVKLIVHLANKEFDPKLPGLEHMFDSNKEGVWPTWWRGVSLLYATELALNAYVKNISEGFTQYIIDQGSCGTDDSILTMVQIHCFQGQCQFRKFDFMDAVKSIFQTRNLDPRLFMFYEDRDATNMTTRDYATFIAWHGAANYINPIKFWVRSALGIKDKEDVG